VLFIYICSYSSIKKKKNLIACIYVTPFLLIFIPKRFQKVSAKGTTFKSIFEEMMECFDKEDLALWAVISRKIWFRRNSVVHGVFSITQIR